MAGVLVVAGACKKEASQQPAAPTEPKPAEAKPAPAPVREDFAATPSTLSLLEPAAGRCEWAKFDPVSKKRLVLGSFEGNCLGALAALRQDGKRGIARFDPRSTHGSNLGNPSFKDFDAPKGMRDRLYDVDIVSGNVRELPLPPLGNVREFGFDKANRLLALTLQNVTDAETAAGAATVDDTEVQLNPESEGIAAIAHAFAWEGGAWKRVETRVTTDGADLSPGVRALEAASDLGYRSAEVLVPRIQGDNETNNALLDKLRASAPNLNDTDGSWIMFGVGEQKYEVWEESAEEALSTGLIFAVEGGNLVKLPEYPYGREDLVAIQRRAPFLLVTQDYVGAHPRMYRGKEHVWSSDTARAVTFWPDVGR